MKKDTPVMTKERSMRRLEKLLCCMGSFCYLFLVGRLKVKIEDSSCNYHRDGQNLPHSESKSEVSESDIRGAHKLYTEAEYTVPDKETRRNLSGEWILSDGKVQYHKEHESFQSRFKEGRREVRNSVFLDCKWSGIRTESKELPVEIVSDTPQSEPDRKNACDLVCHNKKGFLVYLTKEQHGDDNPNCPTMETHASLPSLEYFRGVSQIVGEIVEKHVPEPSAENHPEKYKNHERLQIRI